MTPNQFNTITGSDWRVSLIAARSRRTLNQIKFRNQITEAMKLALPSKSSGYKKVSVKKLAAHADKQAPALALLCDGYSAGWVARALDTAELVVMHWRDEAGIPPCKPGYGRPMSAVGEVLA
jgi:hypothetical protein